MTDPANDACDQCSHPLSLHALVSLEHNPMNGGIALCPVLHCPCFATWGVGENSTPPIKPSDAEIERLRMAVQTGEFT
jgi:hypothetical protein